MCRASERGGRLQKVRRPPRLEQQLGRLDSGMWNSMPLPGAISIAIAQLLCVSYNSESQHQFCGYCAVAALWDLTTQNAVPD
jgi:hypothetical protein